MAVDKSKVIIRLKALFPKANLSQKRLDAIADKLAKKPADDADDSAIDAVINDFNEVYSIEDIAKDDDRLRQLEADKKKAEELAAKKGGQKSSDSQDDDSDDEEIEDAPSWAKSILNQNKKLASEIEALKNGNVLQTKKQTANSLFEKSEILKGLKEELKPRWMDRINLDSETSIEDQIKELESEYTELVQVSADNNSYAGPAGSGSNQNKPDETIVNEIVENLNI